MFRGAAIAALVLAMLAGLSAQGQSVLHLTVGVSDAGGRVIPAARYTLLISDNPTTAPPRRIVTSPDGTADVRLRPGNYTVESDRPLVVQGRSYEWTLLVDIVAGRESTLNLTAANAVVGTATTEAEAAAPVPLERGASSLLTEWQDSVVALWTARAHATGFLVDSQGLVATSQRAIGDAASVEVQLSPAVKVGGTVLVADEARDVAVLWIDPAVTTGVRPVTLPCGVGAGPPLAAGQEIVALESPMRGPRDVTSGEIVSVDSAIVRSDLAVSPSTAGGPVFATDGGIVGLTSYVHGATSGTHDEMRVVPAASICETVVVARSRLADAARPASTRLPVESDGPVPVGALKDAAAKRLFSMTSYRMSSPDFEIVFITPALLALGEAQLARREGRDDGGGLRAVTDFGDWLEYVAAWPPVVMVRVTPRMVESFWMKMARGAATTQGVALPPIKRMRPGFSRMRVSCGGQDVVPIHPFTIESRVSETEGIVEGLYVFDPAALGSQCGRVTLELSSLKETDPAATTAVTPAVIKQIEQDFAAFPAASPASK